MFDATANNALQTNAALIEQVLNNDSAKTLPSLPSLAIEIRQILKSQNVTAKKVAEKVRNDPGLTALLFKYAASPMYRTAAPINSIEGVISRLGFDMTSTILLMHSVRSIFIARSPALKSLFKRVWQRQITKAGLASFIGMKFSLPTGEILTQSLMTDMGSLAILQALNSSTKIPEPSEFYDLCHSYAKPIGVLLLTRWGLDRALIQAVEKSGIWNQSEPGPVNTQDVLNIALYQTELWTNKDAELPPIDTLPAYLKLPPDWREIDSQGGIQLLTNRRQQIEEIIGSIAVKA